MAKLLEKNGAEMCAALVSVAGSVRSFLEDQEFKIQICILLVTGIVDILLKYSDEENIRERLILLLQYNFQGE